MESKTLASSTMKFRHDNVASSSSVAETSFAGRLGANQAFIANSDDESFQNLVKKQPDVIPLQSLKSALSLGSFWSTDLLRQSVLEGWGTFLLIVLVGSLASGLSSSDLSPFSISLYAALTNFIALSLFTYCLGPVSGAHLNPAITMSTLFAGLSTLPRSIAYIAAQSLGAVIAGYWIRLGVGEESYFAKGVIPGCSVVPGTVSVGQLFALEYMYSQAIIFVAFGIGLNPRQGKVIGPTFGPILIGAILALGNLCSNLAKPGYTGMSFNPARCLGLMAARNEMQYHYVHWLAPLAAAILNGIFYRLAPPWARERPLFAGLFSKGHKGEV